MQEQRTPLLDLTPEHMEPMTLMRAIEDLLRIDPYIAALRKCGPKRKRRGRKGRR